MFYSRRVVDMRDGLDKWEGLNDDSRRMDDDGNIIEDDKQKGDENKAEGGTSGSG